MTEMSLDSYVINNTREQRPFRWKFRQCFGEQRSLETIQEGDMLTSVEFSQDGEFIATGDRAGRVVIFEQFLDISAMNDSIEDNPLLMNTSSDSSTHGNKGDNIDAMNIDLDIDLELDLNGNNSVKESAKKNEIDADLSNFALFSTARSKFKHHGKANRGKVNMKNLSPNALTYKFQAEFQSHKPDFDCLKSLEIEEKISKIKWCRPTNDALFLLTTNDKTIKLWKVTEHATTMISHKNLPITPAQSQPNNSTSPLSMPPRTASNSFINVTIATPMASPNIPPRIPYSLKIPKVRRGERKIKTVEKKVYANAHSYHINSISPVCDGETYFSSDDLRINLWNISNSDEVYNVVDIRPDNMEDLAEVITGCEAHPNQNNLFIYCSSRGTIKLNDLRQKSNCDSNGIMFQDRSEYYKNLITKTSQTDADDSFFQQNVGFFSEILATISDIKFIKDGQHIISRDYLTVKVWDVRNTIQPCEVINFLEHLQPELKTLYKNDSLFDKFEVSANSNGNLISTGSYENTFYVFDTEKKTSTCLNVLRGDENVVQTYTQPNRKKPFSPTNSDELMQIDGNSNSRSISDDRFPEHKQKALHLSLHPEINCLAVAIENNLYIYAGE